MMRSIPLVLLLCLAAAPNAVAQVFKCTNPDGSVSYQDRACPEAANENRVSVGSSARKRASGYEGKIIPVPGVGEAAVLVFDYMETIVRDDDGRATTIGIRSKRGSRNKMSMMMTFMPNADGRIPGRQEQETTVKQIAMLQAGGGFFDDFEIYDFQAKSGAGVFTTINDPKFPGGRAPEGEYATITAGQIVDKHVVVAITILSDGLDNKGFTDALAIAETFVVGPGIVAVNPDGGDMRLPDAPAGFTWQRVPEIKGAFLKPTGWHFDTQHEGGDDAYFLSLEPNTSPDGFDTGMTVNVTRNVPGKTGMAPSQYAAAFIEAGASEFEVIGETFSNARGPYVSHGGLFRATDPIKGDFNSQMVAIANDSTGTVYFVIFEAPAKNWAAAWQIGQVMLEKMAINDSI